MKQKRILLTDWARREGMGHQAAKDSAGKGKLRQFARLEYVKTKRWTVPESLTLEQVRLVR